MLAIKASCLEAGHLSSAARGGTYDAARADGPAHGFTWP
jgi:hypothetical protein